MQKAVLFKGTVRDNLLLGGKTATDEELIKVLKQKRVSSFRKKHKIALCLRLIT